VPADLVPILIALAVLAGFIVAARGYLLYGSIQRLADDVQLQQERLEAGPERLRAMSAGTRARLAETNAGLERALWGLTHFDRRADAASTALREHRQHIERVRVRYLEGSRLAMARARQTVRLLKQLQQLRRTFLG
jgi:hypothetical protein